MLINIFPKARDPWLVLLIFATPLLFCQEVNVVRVETFISRDGVQAGETIQAALRVTISDGWHIYSNELADEFLLPTSFSLEIPPGFKLIESSFPVPVKRKFDYAETELSVYEGEVFFGTLLQTDAALQPGKFEIPGQFSYQACDLATCLPPKVIDFKIVIPVVAKGQKTRPANEPIFSKIRFDRADKLHLFRGSKFILQITPKGD
jgi:DsbC/DsbD-like thiol-disulfide interchange protein